MVCAFDVCQTVAEPASAAKLPSQLNSVGTNSAFLSPKYG